VASRGCSRFLLVLPAVAAVVAPSFTVTREFNDMKFVSTYKGKVDGDTMKGTMDAKFGEKDFKQEFEAKRVKVKD
jgi:hypothetical protein